MSINKYTLDELTMESQPNEIITYILSYLDNRELNIARRVNHRWKHLIETRLVPKSIPELFVCILTHDYYHFGKHYLDHHRCNESIQFWFKDTCHTINVYDYYFNLSQLMGNTCLAKQICNKHPMCPMTLTKEEILIYAVHKNHLDIVKYIINLGADVHAYDERALYWSRKYDSMTVAKYLIDSGADINKLNYYVFGNHLLELVEYAASRVKKID